MLGIGDGIVFLMAAIALVYGFCVLISKKQPLFLKLSMATVGCLMLGYIFDICDYIVNVNDPEGYFIGYLGSIGSFLFLLTSSFGYMDGIVDDGSSQIKKYRYIALIGPAIAVALWIPNMIAEVSVFSLYFNLKHAIIPDMGFGFVRAIRPFNLAAFSFALLQLIHLTVWNFCGLIPLLISGTVFGASCIVMVIMADKGVKKWAI